MPAGTLACLVSSFVATRLAADVEAPGREAFVAVWRSAPPVVVVGMVLEDAGAVLLFALGCATVVAPRLFPRAASVDEDEAEEDDAAAAAAAAVGIVAWLLMPGVDDGDETTTDGARDGDGKASGDPTNTAAAAAAGSQRRVRTSRACSPTQSRLRRPSQTQCGEGTKPPSPTR